MAYAELHAHSNFSFLDGASHPEELAAEAARLGLSALALTDHDGFYGVVRFAGAARAVGLPTVFGAELTLSGTGAGHPRTGMPDPDGTHLVVLARDPEGYARLGRVIAEAHLAGGEKGKPLLTLDALADHHGGHWQVLTGCRKGALAAALTGEGPRAAGRALDHLVDRFGRDHVAVELWDHGAPLDTTRNDALAVLAAGRGVDPVATNNVHYATPARFPLATALAAVRSRRALEDLEGWLPPSPTACLRGEAEQTRRFARWPGAVERAAEIGAACAFDLRLVAPRLPDFPVPEGHTEQTWLVELVRRGAADRYGPQGAERVPGAYARLDHELEVIGALGFAGYFLTVWDIVRFCREEDILCQGRGSAATSAVCYALGITNVDAVSLGLLFERFLSPARDGPPDIDVDIESSRREEVIQYVYARYGRLHAAQVANVITYRSRSALRDVGKALGHTADEVDVWAKSVERGEPLGEREDLPPLVQELAGELLDFPRHLGIHSGGMVICDRPVIEVCPVEWGRMPGRSVLQWDKDDCAAAGLVKFDLLGLGMLTALHHMVDLVRAFHQVEIDLARLEQEPRGLRPAVPGRHGGGVPGGVPGPDEHPPPGAAALLLRPGHRGGPHPSRAHPGQRRPPLHPASQRDRAGHLPPPAAPALAGADARGPSLPGAADADRHRRGRVHPDRGGRAAPGDERQALRRAHGPPARPPVHRDGRPRRGRGGGRAGVHRARRLRQLRVPREPLGGLRPPRLLDRLVQGALPGRLHRRVAQRPADGVLVPPEPGRRCQAPRGGRPAARRQRGAGRRIPRARGAHRAGGVRGHRRGGAVRLGLSSVRGVGAETAARIEAGAPWAHMEDLVRRAGVSRAQLEALATAGALDGLAGAGAGGGRRPGRGTGRRSLVWGAGAASQATADRLPGVVTGAEPPPLPAPTPWEGASDDLWSLGMTPDTTAMELARGGLDRRGVLPAGALAGRSAGERVTVGGVVTHRQQPESARGAVFLNLEDETGMVNIVCSRGAWIRWKSVARSCPALLVRGRVERSEGSMTLVAERFEPLPLGPVPASRDFR